MNDRFCVNRLKRCLLEMYWSVRRLTADEIREALDFYGYGILNLNIDLWKPTTEGYARRSKCLGLRVYFVNLKRKMVTYLLCVRAFDPTRETRRVGLVKV